MKIKKTNLLNLISVTGLPIYYPSNRLNIISLNEFSKGLLTDDFPQMNGWINKSATELMKILEMDELTFCNYVRDHWQGSDRALQSQFKYSKDAVQLWEFKHKRKMPDEAWPWFCPCDKQGRLIDIDTKWPRTGIPKKGIRDVLIMIPEKFGESFLKTEVKKLPIRYKAGGVPHYI